MNQIDPQKLMSISVPEKCRQCDSDIFEQVVMFRRIPKLAIAAPNDQLLPIPVFRCIECKTIISDKQEESGNQANSLKLLKTDNGKKKGSTETQ